MRGRLEVTLCAIEICLIEIVLLQYFALLQFFVHIVCLTNITLFISFHIYNL